MNARSRSPRPPKKGPAPRASGARRAPAPPLPDPSLRRDPALESATFEHYADPLLYDHEYRRRRVDVNYYRALAAGRLVPLPGVSTGRSVLELGCGSGRLLVPLVRDGHRVVGVDASPPMLARCRERLARLPPRVCERAELFAADFRQVRLGRRFPLVLAPFNAMMHLYTRSDVERFLAVVRAHLEPEGVFAFDVLNPDVRWLSRDPTKRWARTRFKDPRTGRAYHYSTNHFYEASTQINWIRLYYEEAAGDLDTARAPAEGDLTYPPTPAPPGSRRSASGRPGARPAARPRARIVHLAQRQFFPEELLELLHYNGFSVDVREGGFVGEAFAPESDSQVCRCSIRGGPRRRFFVQCEEPGTLPSGKMVVQRKK